MTDQKEPSEEQRKFLRNLEQKWGEYIDHHRMAQVLTEWDTWRDRDAAQFRRGVEAAIAIVERHYFAAESLTELRNLRGDDDG